MLSLIPIFAVVAANLVNNVAANSIGTGSCAAGISAIGGTHLDFGPDSPSKRMGKIGTVFEGATEIRINGILLTANTPASFPPNTDLTWTAEAMVSPFKGIFVRVQAADDNIFTHTGVSEGLQNAALCDLLETNVIGISHSSATPKVLSSGVMNFSSEGSVTMDISLVFDNVATAVSAFSSYPLTIEVGAPVPTPIAPVAPSPVAAPTVDKTNAPTDLPSSISFVPFSLLPSRPFTFSPAPSIDTPPTADCPDGGKGMGSKCKDSTPTGGKEGMSMGGKEGMSMGGKEGMSMGGKEGMSMGEKEGMSMGDKEGMSMGEKEGMTSGDKKATTKMGDSKDKGRRYLK